ncbi:MAG TPA: glycosyltransferase [Nodularia sp. (in: cyanobacteria)]|nr:glycosyltransferase [Nodularia sp. (in: cyanobacteria)]
MTPSSPLVSICCITYNHEKFIREAINGFLMQQTNFPIEIIIHDDASIDNTASIILEYQAKHPNLINAILQTDNQYSSRGFGFFSDMFDKAQGKYIALCEGDDYWTDPLKLQKQVDFLEANPDFAICFHQVKIWEEGELRDDDITTVPSNISTIVDLTGGNYIHTPSCVFRNNTSKIFGANFSRCPLGDYYIHMMNAQYGNIFCIDEVMAVYRVHRNSIWSSKGLNYRQQKTLEAMIYVLSDLSDASSHVRQQLRLTIVNLAVYLYKYLPDEFGNKHHISHEAEKYIIKILGDEVELLRGELQKGNSFFVLLDKLSSKLSFKVISIVKSLFKKSKNKIT